MFTDAFYHAMFEGMKPAEKKWATEVGIHYKKYSKAFKPVGEPFKNANGPILEVSAGSDQHELTTGCSTEAFLQFI